MEIIATFKNGRKIRYTVAVLGLLATDPEVLEVMDAATGEILYSK